MLPVMPMTSGSNRRRHAAATACSARSGSGTSTIDDVAQRVEGRLARSRHRAAGRPAGAAAPADGRGGEEAVAVGALAGQRDEQHAGLDQPGVDGAAADRAVAVPDERAAGRGDEVCRGAARERRPTITRPSVA